MKREIVTGFVVVLWASNLPLRGQEVKLTPARITVIDAPYREFSLGEEFKINVESTELRRAGGASRVQARVFRGEAEGMSRRGVRSADGCRTYSSATFGGVEYNGGITFGSPFQSADWLAVVHSVRADQVFVLVFETNDGSGRFLKLREEDVGEYFAMGYHFIVQAGDAAVALSPNELSAIQAASRAGSLDLRRFAAAGPCLQLAGAEERDGYMIASLTNASCKRSVE